MRIAPKFRTWIDATADRNNRGPPGAIRRAACASTMRALTYLNKEFGWYWFHRMLLLHTRGSRNSNESTNWVNELGKEDEACCTG